MNLIQKMLERCQSDKEKPGSVRIFPYAAKSREDADLGLYMDHLGEVHVYSADLTDFDKLLHKKVMLFWSIDQDSTAHEVRLLQNELRSLLQRVHNGHTVDKKGRGHLSKDAQKAEAEIFERLEY